MRCAVVVHGPEAVDTGLALRVLELLESEYDVRAVMSGYTGVAAVVDAGLQGRIDIREHHVPSVTLRRLAPEVELLVLVNSAKDEGSALRFGSIVSSRCADILVPLVQVDALMVLPWNDALRQALQLADALGIPLMVPTRTPDEEEEGWRRLGGVHPGENVWINGVVVGKATSEDVRIHCEEGRLQAHGIALKETGVRRRCGHSAHPQRGDPTHGRDPAPDSFSRRRGRPSHRSFRRGGDHHLPRCRLCGDDRG